MNGWIYGDRAGTMKATLPRVYFMPLYYSPNPWVMEIPDSDTIVPLSVKVTAIPISDQMMTVTEVDVFSIHGYMPPYPKSNVSQMMLLDSIRWALEEKAETVVKPISWDIVIYGGR